MTYQRSKNLSWPFFSPHSCAKSKTVVRVSAVLFQFFVATRLSFWKCEGYPV